MIGKSYAETFAAHTWEIEFEVGSFHIRCLDPCDTFECTPECARSQPLKILETGRTFNLVETPTDECTCGQYAKWRADYDARGGSICACMSEVHEMVCGSIRVDLEFVDQSTPGGPWGGPEYDYYVEVHPSEQGRDDRARDVRA